jgi:hypothetical protein
MATVTSRRIRLVFCALLAAALFAAPITVASGRAHTTRPRTVKVAGQLYCGVRRARAANVYGPMQERRLAELPAVQEPRPVRDLCETAGADELPG